MVLFVALEGRERDIRLRSCPSSLDTGHSILK